MPSHLFAAMVALFAFVGAALAMGATSLLLTVQPWASGWWEPSVVTARWCVALLAVAWVHGVALRAWRSAHFDGSDASASASPQTRVAAWAGWRRAIFWRRFMWRIVLPALGGVVAAMTQLVFVFHDLADQDPDVRADFLARGIDRAMIWTQAGLSWACLALSVALLRSMREAVQGQGGKVSSPSAGS